MPCVCFRPPLLAQLNKAAWLAIAQHEGLPAAVPEDGGGSQELPGATHSHPASAHTSSQGRQGSQGARNRRQIFLTSAKEGAWWEKVGETVRWTRWGY